MRFRVHCYLLFLSLVTCVANASANGVDDSAPSANPDYSIEIDKSSRQLLLKQGNRIARRYTAALGRGGPGEKQIRGDNKTPEGVYYVTGFNDQSAFDIFMRLNYPNVKDGFFGLQRALITRREFDRIVDAQRQDALPPQNTPLGGAVGIHGLGDESAEKLKIQANLDWTKGCIALTNREIRELRSFVGVGTRVVIRE
jgi:murein L,D-transpeptidase YafK